MLENKDLIAFYRDPDFDLNACAALKAKRRRSSSKNVMQAKHKSEQKGKRKNSKSLIAGSSTNVHQNEISPQEGGAIIGIFASNLISLLYICLASTF